MTKKGKRNYKQFTIDSLEKGLLVLRGLIVPVIIDLEKFHVYSQEAAELLKKYKKDDSIPAREYDSIHDKLLYQQRELLRFIADEQTTSFSYIRVRKLLVKRGYLKRALAEEKKETLNELLRIRNWSFHNTQSMTVADFEIAKSKIPDELKGVAEIKPLLNPVVVTRVKSYSWETLSLFIAHNTTREKQFVSILDEMKADYQDMYNALPEESYVNTKYFTGLTRSVQYVTREVEDQTPQKAGADIVGLSVGIQKGKYDGSKESLQRWTRKNN